MTVWRLFILAWRNLWRARRRTLITVSMVALGFTLAVWAISLGDGAHQQMIDSAIQMGDGHLTIQPKGYLATPSNGLYLHHGEALLTHPPLVNADAQIAPRIVLQVLASTAYNSIGGELEGVAPNADPYADLLRPELVEGQWLQPGDKQGVVIGVKMADKLKIKVGSKIVLMVGGEDGDVESRLARVRGVFDSKLDSLDSFFVLSTLELARGLLPGRNADDGDTPVTRLAIYLHDPDQQAALKAQLEADPPPEGVVLDWQEMMPQVVNFVIADDMGNYIWLVFILVMVAVGILNTILMSALERTREFGLLRALGLKGRHVLLLMLFETILLAAVSLAVGWALGGVLHAYFSVYGLDLSSFYPEGVETGGMYMDPVMYTRLSPGRIGALTLIVFVTTLLSGLYPAIKAARVAPVAALRT